MREVRLRSVNGRPLTDFYAVYGSTGGVSAGQQIQGQIEDYSNQQTAHKLRNSVRVDY